MEGWGWGRCTEQVRVILCPEEVSQVTTPLVIYLEQLSDPSQSFPLVEISWKAGIAERLIPTPTVALFSVARCPFLFAKGRIVRVIPVSEISLKIQVNIC
jgi:hypothetical protein